MSVKLANAIFVLSNLTDGSDHSKEVQKTDYNVEIKLRDMVCLSKFFDCLDLLVDLLNLTPAEKGEVKQVKDKEDYQTAVHFSLTCWKKHNPGKATYQKLIQDVYKMGKEEIAFKIEGYFRSTYN